MKAVIVNCFDTYEDRVDLLHYYFTNKGYDVTVVQSDFRHFAKMHRTDVKQDFIFIKSKPYCRNMSIARISSHYNYAKNAFELVEKIKPDLLYVIIPPNSLAKFATKYKKKNKNVKLILDLMDLWPETMPVGKVKILPIFTVWKFMRDNSLRFADFVITECDLYQEILENKLKGIKTETVYLAKRDIYIDAQPLININEIHLCYLGSINNIIDIPKIKAVIKEIHEIKPTTLHIIGDGESRDILLNEIKDVGATVKYYGKIYDPEKKQDIFDRCHFGLNIMKDSVCVGLTMKSIDYFQYGLPILNNIQADTTKLVDIHKIGINIKNNNFREIANMISSLDLREFMELRRNTSATFKSLFSIKAFYRKLDQIFRNI